MPGWLPLWRVLPEEDVVHLEGLLHLNGTSNIPKVPFRGCRGHATAKRSKTEAPPTFNDFLQSLPFCSGYLSGRFQNQTITNMKTAHAVSISLISAVLLIPVISKAQNIPNNSKQEVPEMSADQRNKEVIRTLYTESLNKRNMELLQDFIAEDFSGSNQEKGPAAFARQVHTVLNALPDAEWQIQELVAEGNKVVVRWKLQGTHTGPFRTMAPTGNKVSNDGMGFFELKDGKVIKGLVYTDRLGFLQELDVLPLDLLSANGGAREEQVRFIDTFHLPREAREEFMHRVDINRNFIKDLPGFVEDAAYERTDEHGNLVFVTVAVWENEAALEHAKAAVQAEYKKQGFHPAEMFERLNITVERGTFKEVLLQQ